MAGVTPLKLSSPDLQQFQSGDFVPYNFGGTGQTAVAQGDLLYGSAANVWSRLVIGTAGQVLIVNGAGTLPTWSSAPAGLPVLLSLTNGNAGAITQGQVVYYNGTADKVDLAKADSITTARAIGVVYDASIASGASGNILVGGLCPGALSAATAGTVYYLSDATAGLLTTTAPTTGGHAVEKMGIAQDATKLLLQIGPITLL